MSRLRDLLVELYPTQESSRRVVNDAGLPHGRIAFRATAVDNWHEILGEAGRRERLEALLGVASGDYPERREELEAAFESYSSPDGDRDRPALAAISGRDGGAGSSAPLSAAAGAPRASEAGSDRRQRQGDRRGSGDGRRRQSVLAAAIAGATEVQEAFSEVVWITVGQQPDLLELQHQLAVFTDDHRTLFRSVHQGKLLLRRALAGRSLLLVLDDVWDLKHASFLDVVGERGRVVVTSRNREILVGLGAEEIEIEVFASEQARALLADWTGQRAGELP